MSCLFCQERIGPSSSACLYAACHGSYQVCEYYAQMQTTSEDERTEAFFMSIVDQRLALCELFLKYDGIPCSRASAIIAWLPIHYAADCGYIEIIKLLDNGADINAQENDFGSTALHAAASVANGDIVAYLVNREADREVVDSHGVKPYRMDFLSCFAEKGNPLAVKQAYLSCDS